MKKIKVKIFGPNLTDQSLGSFHVHAADCRDCGKYKGEQTWGMEAETCMEIVRDVYADQIAESPDYPASEYLHDFHFAPCLNNLPEGV